MEGYIQTLLFLFAGHVLKYGLCYLETSSSGINPEQELKKYVGIFNIFMLAVMF